MTKLKFFVKYILDLPFQGSCWVRFAAQKKTGQDCYKKREGAQWPNSRLSLSFPPLPGFPHKGGARERGKEREGEVSCQGGDLLEDIGTPSPRSYPLLPPRKLLEASELACGGATSTGRQSREQSLISRAGLSLQKTKETTSSSRAVAGSSPGQRLNKDKQIYVKG